MEKGKSVSRYTREKEFCEGLRKKMMSWMRVGQLKWRKGILWVCVICRDVLSITHQGFVFYLESKQKYFLLKYILPQQDFITTMSQVPINTCPTWVENSLGVKLPSFIFDIYVHPFGNCRTQGFPIWCQENRQ